MGGEWSIVKRRGEDGKGLPTGPQLPCIVQSSKLVWILYAIAWGLGSPVSTSQGL